MAKRPSDVRVVGLIGDATDRLGGQMGPSFRTRAQALRYIEAECPAGVGAAIVKVLAIVRVAEESQPTRVVREVQG